MTAARRLPIGTRVRLRGRSECATVFAVPYTFRGRRQVAVVWDHQPKFVLTVEVARLELVELESPTVPPEARPVSVGAMAGGGGRS